MVIKRPRGRLHTSIAQLMSLRVLLRNEKPSLVIWRPRRVASFSSVQLILLQAWQRRAIPMKATLL